jgi:hypothetical protein
MVVVDTNIKAILYNTFHKKMSRLNANLGGTLHCLSELQRWVIYKIITNLWCVLNYPFTYVDNLDTKLESYFELSFIIAKVGNLDIRGLF